MSICRRVFLGKIAPCANPVRLGWLASTKTNRRAWQIQGEHRQGWTEMRTRVVIHLFPGDFANCSGLICYFSWKSHP
jgi:hypothetical protein